MKCSRCGYFNVPGVDICGRCGMSLSAATAPASFDELYPPRARDRDLGSRIREPLQRAVLAQRSSGSKRRPNTTAAETWETIRNESWESMRPWLLASCAVVPGLVQLFQRRWTQAGWLIGIAVALTAAIFLTIHLPVSDVLIWSLLALCAVSVWDIANLTFPGWEARESDAEYARVLRTLRLGALAIGIVASTIVGIYGIFSRRYDVWILRSDRGAPLLLNGDGLIVRHLDAGRSVLQRGDLVVYLDDYGAPRVDRIVGLPGDQIATQGTSLLINEAIVPTNRLPMLYRPLSTPVSAVVPQGKVCFWQDINHEEAGFAEGMTPCLMIDIAQIRGEAVALYQPATRRRWLH